MERRETIYTPYTFFMSLLTFSIPIILVFIMMSCQSDSSKTTAESVVAKADVQSNEVETIDSTNIQDQEKLLAALIDSLSNQEDNFYFDHEKGYYRTESGSPYLGKLPTNPAIEFEGNQYNSLTEILSLADSNMTIYIPSGMYDYELLVEKKKNIRIEANDGPAFFNIPADDRNVCAIKDSKNIILKNIFFKHNVARNKCEYGTSALSIYNSEDIVVDHCYLNGSGYYGLDVSGVKKLVVKHSVIEETMAEVVKISGSDQVFMYDNFFDWKQSISVSKSQYSGKTSIDESALEAYDGMSDMLINILETDINAFQFDLVMVNNIGQKPRHDLDSTIFENNLWIDDKKSFKQYNYDPSISDLKMSEKLRNERWAWTPDLGPRYFNNFHDFNSNYTIDMFYRVNKEDFKAANSIVQSNDINLKFTQQISLKDSVITPFDTLMQYAVCDDEIKLVKYHLEYADRIIDVLDDIYYVYETKSECSSQFFFDTSEYIVPGRIELPQNTNQERGLPYYSFTLSDKPYRLQVSTTTSRSIIALESLENNFTILDFLDGSYSEDMEVYGFQFPLWIGDLNGDKLPDFYFYHDTKMCESTKVFYLSNQIFGQYQKISFTKEVQPCGC